jgi:hypothetical protein
MSIFTRWILNKIRRRKNVILCATGATGSGKSYACLQIAEQIDKNFTTDHVFFDVKSLIHAVQNEKLKAGTVLILEEVGVNIDSRRFYSLVNKAMVYLTETFRSSRLILLLNLPSINGLDKRVRQLLHGVIDMRTIDTKENKSKCRFYIIQTNSITGKMYKKSLWAGGIKYRWVWFSKPTKPLLKIYEQKKSKFRKALQGDLIKELAHHQQLKEQQAPIDTDAIIKKIVKNKERYIRKYGGRTFVDRKLISADFNLGQIRAENIKAAAEKEIGL